MKVHNETQLRGLISIQHVVYLQRLDERTGRQVSAKQATTSGFIFQNKQKCFKLRPVKIFFKKEYRVFI